MANTKQLFVAVELPEEAAQALQKVQKKLQEKNLIKGTWTAPDQLHITLKFIGEVPADSIDSITQLLDTINVQSFFAGFEGLGVLPAPDMVRIVQADIDSIELDMLAQFVDEALMDVLEESEPSPFLSHVTLARVDSVEDKKALMAVLAETPLPEFTFDVDEFVLKSSELTVDGPVYTEIERFSLAE